MALARQHNDLEREQDLLFQLDVLAYETQRPGEAEKLMTERVALLKQKGETDLLETAQQDLGELHRKLGRR